VTAAVANIPSIEEGSGTETNLRSLALSEMLPPEGVTTKLGALMEMLPPEGVTTKLEALIEMLPPAVVGIESRGLTEIEPPFLELITRLEDSTETGVLSIMITLLSGLTVNIPALWAEAQVPK